MPQFIHKKTELTVSFAKASKKPPEGGLDTHPEAGGPR